MNHNTGQLNSTAELKRKAIHLATSVFPIVYFFCLTQEQISIIFVILTILFLLAELIRYQWPLGKNLFIKIFFPLLRENEKYDQLTGATLFFISATITFILFEKTIAVPAVLILSVCDSLAAIFGKRTGKHKFLAKSLEGSITFFVCCVVLLLIFKPEMDLFGIIAVGGLLTVLEAAAVPVNDNLLIPVPAALLLKLFS